MKWNMRRKVVCGRWNLLGKWLDSEGFPVLPSKWIQRRHAAGEAAHVTSSAFADLKKPNPHYKMKAENRGVDWTC